MESKFQLMTKDFEFKLSALQLEKDKSDDKLRAFERQREDIIKENGRLRAAVNDAENFRRELEHEQEKTRELHRKCQKLETEINSNSSLEHELTEINLRLKNELSACNQEISRSKDQISRVSWALDDLADQFLPLKYLNRYYIVYKKIWIFTILLPNNKINQGCPLINYLWSLSKNKDDTAIFNKVDRFRSELLNFMV